MDGKLAKSSASYLGFSDSDLTTDLKGDIYKWKDITTGSTLEIRIKTKEMLLQTPIAEKAALFTKGNLTYSWALESANSMLKATNRFSDPAYASGYQTVKLGKYIESTVAESPDQKDAQIAQVNFFRNIEKYPVYGPDPKRGLLYALIAIPTSGTGPLRFPIVEAYYWELESKSMATYPLIPLTTAWQSVSEGKGIIVSVVPKNKSPFEDYQPVRLENILINDVYLAYYETPEFQKYLQPIYVFQGNYTTIGTQGGDIMLYFPALSGEYVQ